MHVPDIKNYPDALKLFQDSRITLGTDLEITLHKRESRFSAISGLKYWQTVKDGKVGTDGRTSFFQFLIELRPDPAKTGDEVVNNIVNIVRKEIENNPSLKQYIWKAGTGEFSLMPGEVGEGKVSFLPKGGHIHFGSLTLDPNIIYAFDTLLAPLSLLLEEPTRAIFRRGRTYRFNGGTLYGQLGGYRKSAKYPTWEYRTLPNFVVNRLSGVFFFNAAKAIASEISNGNPLLETIKKKIKILAPDVMAYNFCLKHVFRKRIDTIFEILGSLKLLNNSYGRDLISCFRKYIENTPMWPTSMDMLKDFQIIPEDAIKTLHKGKITVKERSLEYLKGRGIRVSLTEAFDDVSDGTMMSELVIPKANYNDRLRASRAKIMNMEMDRFIHLVDHTDNFSSFMETCTELNYSGSALEAAPSEILEYVVENVSMIQKTFNSILSNYKRPAGVTAIAEANRQQLIQANIRSFLNAQSTGTLITM